MYHNIIFIPEFTFDGSGHNKGHAFIPQNGEIHLNDHEKFSLG